MVTYIHSVPINFHIEHSMQLVMAHSNGIRKTLAVFLSFAYMFVSHSNTYTAAAILYFSLCLARGKPLLGKEVAYLNIVSLRNNLTSYLRQVEY